MAAEFAECAGEQGKNLFWDFVDGVYLNQGETDLESLTALASNLVLDPAEFEACLISGHHNTTWQIDRARGLALGVQSTPTIFLAYVDASGEVVRLQFQGARDFDAISNILDAILRELEE